MTKQKILWVDTSPDKRFIVEGITKDATTEACIFDLIDNSIDAARDIIVKRKNSKKDRYGLPKDYSGFHILLHVDESGVRIEDNCGGIAVRDLERSAMKVGGRSSHAFGIGHYGVGLKRALFKLGRIAQIDSDSGKQRVTLELSIEDYMADPDWGVSAIELPSTGKTKTTITVTDPTAEVASEFSDQRWTERLEDSLAVRYANFINKGLEIKLDVKSIPAATADMRKDEEFSFYRDRLFKTKSGVKFYLSAGVHAEYRFSTETGFNVKISRDITKEFGWYVQCNDRVIVVANRGAETGWPGWHGEYNGFLGTVHFIDEEPDKLPWNTTKTGVDLNNSSYQEALIHMQDIATDWRQRAKKYRKPKSGLLSSGRTSAWQASPSGTTQTSGIVHSTASGVGGRPATGQRPSHHKDLIYLLPLLRTISESTKIKALLFEASTLVIKDHQYTSVLLFRTLIESVLSDYLKRHRKYKDAKELVFADSPKRWRSASEEEKKKYRPTLADMVDFAIRNPDIFPDDHSKMCKSAFDAYKRQSNVVNNIVHEDHQTVDAAWIVALRDRVQPTLALLLTH